MSGEHEPQDISDGPGKLEQAKDAVLSATEAAQETAAAVARAVEEARRPGGPLDRLAEWTRAAPLHSLAIAALLGIVLGRRR